MLFKKKNFREAELARSSSESRFPNFDNGLDLRPTRSREIKDRNREIKKTINTPTDRTFGGDLLLDESPIKNLSEIDRNENENKIKKEGEKDKDCTNVLPSENIIKNEIGKGEPTNIIPLNADNNNQIDTDDRFEKIQLELSQSLSTLKVRFEINNFTFCLGIECFYSTSLKIFQSSTVITTVDWSVLCLKFLKFLNLKIYPFCIFDFFFREKQIESLIKSVRDLELEVEKLNSELSNNMKGSMNDRKLEQIEQENVDLMGEGKR